MYNAVIVDDEILVIKSLKGSINWEEQGFIVVGHALNGMDCLELIEENTPDIIFTDIRMPGMSGLELIKKVHKIHPEIQFVVVSGYAEFAYAQKAIINGAIGYCLKPFDDDEIINVLKKAKNILDMNKNNNTKPIDIFSILDESVSKNFYLYDLFKRYGIETDKENKAIIAVLIGNDKINIQNNINNKFINAKIGSNKNLYIINCDENDNITNYIKNIGKDTMGIGICYVSCSCNDIKNKIDEACITAYQYFITNKNDIYYSNKLCINISQNIIKELEQLRTKKDITNLKAKLDEFNVESKKNGYTIKHAMRVFNIIMSMMSYLSDDTYDYYIYSYEQLTKLFSNLQEMVDYLKSILNKQLTSHPEIIPEHVKNETFRNILKHTNANFCNNISIQTLAKEFIINPSYICQMFKNDLGVTFSEYLTDMRIAKAQDLLKLTDLPIGEIADKSGYNDYFHFAKTFKKIVGITPSQYRLNKS